jgi:hypothetical protein
MEIEWLLSCTSLDSMQLDLKTTPMLVARQESADGIATADSELAELMEFIQQEHTIETSIFATPSAAGGRVSVSRFDLARHPAFATSIQTVEWYQHGALVCNALHQPTPLTAQGLLGTQSAVDIFFAAVWQVMRALANAEAAAIVVREVEWHRTCDSVRMRLQMIVRKTAKRRAQGSDSSFEAGGEDEHRRGQKLDAHATRILRGWITKHRENPYPDEDEKDELALQTGLRIEQINNWFINARRRLLKKLKAVSS